MMVTIDSVTTVISPPNLVLPSYTEVHPSDTVLPGPGRFTAAEVESIRQEALAKHDDFMAYAVWWHNNTDALSSPTKKVADPAYRHVVAMGKAAIPLILSDLKIRGGYWFPALEEIVQWSPLTTESPYGTAYAKAAWLDWGAARGFIE